MCFMGKICKLCSCLIVVAVVLTVLFGFGWMKKAGHACVQGHSVLGKCNGSFIAPPPSWGPVLSPVYDLLPPLGNDNFTSSSVQPKP
ncbi:hypothetical protein MPTK1_7g05210 [Marchantia polymorpha subsp. ruderalis]